MILDSYIYDTDENTQFNPDGTYNQGITNDVMSMDDRNVYKTINFKDGHFTTSD